MPSTNIRLSRFKTKLNTIKRIVLCLSVSISSGYADQFIEIVGGNNAGNPKLAIVNFNNEDGSINDELSSDFKISGEFNVVSYSDHNLIDPGIQYSLQGSLESDSSGTLQIEYQLINNTTKEVLLNQTATFNSKYQRKAIHTISNNVYQKLTNTPGDFTSKIALAVKQNSHKYSVLVADYDGYNSKTLISTAHPISSLAWDKSGQYLSYVTYETGKPVVYVQNIQQGSRYIVANFDGSNSSPSFMPSSQKLAVTLSKDYGSHIYLVNNQRFTYASPAIPLLNFGTIDTEADIADSGKLLFTSDHDGGPQIFMSDVNGSAPIRITNGLGNYNTTARFSNDDQKITFINRNNGILQTYVLNLNTKSAYPISQNTNHDVAPSFAPNNKLVLFSSDGTVYISSITGTTQTKLNKLTYTDIIDQRWARNF